jgi:bifunctional ADP-heptose synthase (sugar kinase/adenylyltransferase)
MVIGSDYKDRPIIGSEFIKEIIYFNRVRNKSTTNILNYGKTNSL